MEPHLDLSAPHPDRSWTCPVCGHVENIPWKTISFVDTTGISEPLEQARTCQICISRIKGEHAPLKSRTRPRRKWHSNPFRLRTKPRFYS